MCAGCGGRSADGRSLLNRITYRRNLVQLTLDCETEVIKICAAGVRTLSLATEWKKLSHTKIVQIIVEWVLAGSNVNT